jgi:hypothetical protein
MEFFAFLAMLFSHAGAPEFFLAACAAIGLGKAIRKNARRRNMAKLPSPPPADDRARLKEARRALPRLEQMDLRRLPASLRLKVAQIRRKIEALLRYADQFPVGSEDLYIIQRTATDYLPTTIRTYLAMPPGSENTPVDAQGRTAWRILWDQLAMIEARLDGVASEVRRRNIDKLVANGRFLEERFKHVGGSELDLEEHSDRR